MSLHFYNTVTKVKEKFEPITPGVVKMYVCGPTVYDLVHIGNMRGPIFMNLVRNWFEQSGYKVTYVQNYTDVDDKIINRANQDKVSALEVSEKYIEEYKKDYDSLHLAHHDHNPKVTEFVPQIVSFIQKIIENGKAYVTSDGEVIYSVRSFEGYGKLSHKNIEELQSGIRVEISDKKKDPLDFTLWKPAKPGEPFWPSPWGNGRPGWHIECSVMATELLGESFDIHAGGIDLIFPHHENEIAQSEAATLKPYVKYWLHWNFINFGAHKMSKSLGNVKTGRSFIEQFHPEILKFMILRAHYRSLVDFSVEQIDDAIHGLARIYSSLCLAKCALREGAVVATEQAPDTALTQLLEKTKTEMTSSLNDDFNTPKVFAELFELVRFFNSQYKRGQKVTPTIYTKAKLISETIKSWGAMMSLFQMEPDQFLNELDNLLLEKKNLKREDIDQLVQERNAARTAKDFKKSDEMRDSLAKMGITIQDTPQGTFWEVTK